MPNYSVDRLASMLSGGDVMCALALDILMSIADESSIQHDINDGTVDTAISYLVRVHAITSIADGTDWKITEFGKDVLKEIG